MTRTTRTYRILPLFAAGLLLGGCDDDPTGVEEHIEVEGVAIMEGATELYRYMLDDGAPPPFTLTLGEREVAFVLLDHDGEPLEEHDHEHEGEELEFQVNVEDTGVLTWTPEDHAHEHEHLEFHGELDARQTGTTTMELCVPHGDHCDFDADVPVTITTP